MVEEYGERNQKSYSIAANSHAKFGLKSTLYLAYRDCQSILQKHLFERTHKLTYRVLDYGCGAGFSTSLYSQIIREAGYRVEIFGADINEENLSHAKIKVPEASFIKILPNQPLDDLGKFDLIICNLVLVELAHNQMEDTVVKLQPLLHETGTLISTNTTRQAYKSSNSWYTLNNKFEENSPQDRKDGKMRLKEDQKVSLAVIEPETGQQLFRFFDFFHSGNAYRKAYDKAGLRLVETHRPVGKQTDGLPWRSEFLFSPYKIHVLYPIRSPDLTSKLSKAGETLITARL